MTRTQEIEALKDAAEIVDAIVAGIEQRDWDQLPNPLDLSRFADHCRLLADTADERTIAGEHFPGNDDEEAD